MRRQFPRLRASRFTPPLRHHHPRQYQPAADQLPWSEQLADQQKAEQPGEDRLGREDQRGVRGRREALGDGLDAERGGGRQEAGERSGEEDAGRSSGAAGVEDQRGRSR